MRVPRETTELIEAYLPIAPDPPRRCNLVLYNHIERGLSLCQSYSKGVAIQLLQPGFLIWWFLQECDLVAAALVEFASALNALEEEIKRIYPSANENPTEEDRMRACWESVYLYVLARRRAMIPIRATCTTARLLSSVCS